MAISYADKQIFEALKKAKGNKAKARQYVMAMLAEDSHLLMMIAKPHLQGIVSLAIERTITTMKRAAKADDLPPIPKDAKGDRFGLDLLKALGGPNAAKFGQESAAPPVKKKKASDDHVKALKMMASKSKTKPKS